ncbi:substrate-binding periplasmic protein [Vogesella oryzae]|uniref:substrate-binding periplasmic protein n=1 Tax=Vogesella oryzae TaxID=1735285 RepID=UPI001582CBDD|nr:transporter substrate-binding domain-containing protein [Vogesella oryzae]
MLLRSGWLVLLAAPVLATPSGYRFVTEEFPPYTYATSQAAGPMVDVLNALCDRLALSCRIDVLPWRRALQLAEEGRADGIFTVVDMPARRQYFYISPPVIRARYVFAERADTLSPWHSLADIAGRTIGVYGPSASEQALAELGAGMRYLLSEETDNLVALRKLAGGRYGTDGLVLVNEGVAQWLIRYQGIEGLRLLPAVRDLQYSFGLSRLRFNAADAARFAAALQQMCRRGEMARLVRRYDLQPAGCQP